MLIREKQMKKLLGVSIAAILTVIPAMSYADGERTVTKIGATTPEANTIVATMSYVKGAHKNVADKVDALIDDTAVTGTHSYIGAGKSVSYNLEQLDAAVATLSGGAGAGTVSEQIRNNAENANYTAPEGGNGIGANSIGGAIDELADEKQNKTDSNVTSDNLTAAGLTTDNLTPGTGVASNLIKVAGDVKTINNKTITYVTTWGSENTVTKSISQFD
jgi:hypothetical protein